MPKANKVAVLMGGLSAEREISLLSGQAVLEALISKGVDAQAFDPAQQELNQLKELNFSHCFICLHGRLGEDGCIQGALEYLGIPYTGPGVLASAMAMNKTVTKTIWRNAGLPVAPDVVLKASQYTAQQLPQIEQALNYPIVVKPNCEGSSIGVAIVHNQAELAQAIDTAFKQDKLVLCEEFIQGKELTCAILGSGKNLQALPLIWIEAPTNEKYDYKNKYFTDLVTYHIPSGLAPSIEQDIQTICLRAYEQLGCRGWSRVDLIFDATRQKTYLLEINTSPGMTSHSLVPKAAQAVGIGYADLCWEILTMATLDNK